MIDDGDFERVNQYRWCLTKKTKGGHQYAITFKRGKNLGMHRLIMDNPKNMEVDHINGETLDNRKNNLRVCTRSQNQMNRKISITNKSGIKGVYYQGDGLPKPWGAVIQINKVKKWLGSFTTKELAGKAYIQYAKSIVGEFAFDGIRIDKSVL